MLTGTKSSETCNHLTAPAEPETWKTSAQRRASRLGFNGAFSEFLLSLSVLYAFLMRGVHEQLNLFPMSGWTTGFCGRM